jgi:putative protease
MGTSQYVGDVTGYADGLAEVEVKNRFAVGDRLELVHPAGNEVVEVATLFKVGPGGTATAADVAPGNGHVVRMPLPPGKEGAFLARLENA